MSVFKTKQTLSCVNTSLQARTEFMRRKILHYSRWQTLFDEAYLL